MIFGASFRKGPQLAEIADLRLVQAKRQFPPFESVFAFDTHCENARLVEAKR